MKAQLDVPPLTLTLSPEYEGEGTGCVLRRVGGLNLCGHCRASVPEVSDG